MEDTGTFGGLLVDYGGVMTTSMGRAFAAFALEAGVDPERFKAVIEEAYGGGDPDGMVARVERGLVPQAEFERWLAGRLSPGAAAPIAAAGLKHRLFGALEPDPDMVAAVGAARAGGIRTGLVSNSWGESGYERDRFGDLFDAVVISAEVSLRKPEPAIYVLAAERIGVPPARCVFVDDLLHNVEGARSVGMEGIVHRSAEFTIPKLEALLGVSLARDPEAPPPRTRPSRNPMS
ncbi:MAG: HAD-IA family hydrolase [Actinomycetota bacterium]